MNFPKRASSGSFRSAGKKISRKVRSSAAKLSPRNVQIIGLESRGSKVERAIPIGLFVKWVGSQASVSIDSVVHFFTSRGELRIHSAARERLEVDVKARSISEDLQQAISYNKNTLPPASAETEAYLADLKRRTEERRLKSSNSGERLNVADHIVNGMVTLHSERGKTVRINGKRGKTLSVKSF